MESHSQFPNIITDLPQAEISIQGLTAYLLQGNNQQAVFMHFEKDIEVAEHAHEAQWGAVLEGEIELAINGKKLIFKKGDTYFIPRDVLHSAKIKAGYRDITLFNQRDRYKCKI
jgi:quercetin dioxygenase-like cupin family protein